MRRRVILHGNEHVCRVTIISISVEESSNTRSIEEESQEVFYTPDFIADDIPMVPGKLHRDCIDEAMRQFIENVVGKDPDSCF